MAETESDIEVVKGEISLGGNDIDTLKYYVKLVINEDNINSEKAIDNLSEQIKGEIKSVLKKYID